MAGSVEQIGLQEPALARKEEASTRDEQFTALVARQARFVFRVSYSVLRNVQDADDAAQETFLKLYRSGRWAAMTDERAFLARIAWRVAVDQLKRRPIHAPDSEAEPARDNPEEAAIASDWNAVVGRLIDALPEELRQPLALSGFEELTSREIADVMGLPEGTVRTRIMRARQILKKKLNSLRAGHHER